MKRIYRIVYNAGILSFDDRNKETLIVVRNPLHAIKEFYKLYSRFCNCVCVEEFEWKNGNN